MVANRWDESEAARWVGDTAQRIYTSRLLGVDPDLVLHGGGNTSVKVAGADVFGDPVDVLVVKASGADLSEVDESGFARLRLDHVRRLATLPALSDTDMARQMLAAALAPGGPAPSVEAILHAVLPFTFVDHTHADAIVTVANTVDGEAMVRRVFGGGMVIVPYVMPGFLLAKAVAATAIPVKATGMVLMNHGIFTWGETARESYDRMIELVSQAEAYVAERRRPSPPIVTPHATPELRAAISAAAGVPMIVSAAPAPTPPSDVTQRGPITPDHVIRTKPWPLLGTDVDGYVARYQAYFGRHAGGRNLLPLDPAPRVILDGGLLCAGRTAKDTRIAADIYRHTLRVMGDAEALGGYRPIGEADLFDFEYWELEQAKLLRAGPPKPFAGEIAVVTGAASGIGRACAAALLAEGAAVVGLDRNPEVKAVFDGDAWLGIEADVTDDEAVGRALEDTVLRFGGLDMLVLNAGVFPPSAPVAGLTPDVWRQTMAVNLDANVGLLRHAHPLLRLAPRGGRVVVVGSKNVRAPGPGAAAYSASKAALTQLARVTALEWGADNIRVNVIHPNAVFDTGVWSDEVIAERAGRYGMTAAEYRTNNLLPTEVTSADVARLCVAMCGRAFAKTTGAQVPVDGGNDRVV
ncbi:MAG: bifunctional aldolase/short-chain dehydrogenase [Acidimicrobiales bacterium]